MPRHARLLLSDVPLHVCQRAVDRRACFLTESDFQLYLGLTRELSQETGCDIHAYVLMTNHVHLLYRYIELNPVRAAMVAGARDYPWSSYGHNALGIPSLFVTPHPAFLAMAPDEDSRREAYAAYVRGGIAEDDLVRIRKALNANAALGDEHFVREVARLTGRPAEVRLRGRPAKKKCLSPV